MIAIGIIALIVLVWVIIANRPNDDKAIFDAARHGDCSHLANLGTAAPGYPQPGGAAQPLSEVDIQTHRLLRRGIPFGPPFPLYEDTPVADAGDRRLLFVVYQTSLMRQFEFVTKQWVNNPDFKDGSAGHDPILGQNGSDPNRARQFQMPQADGTTKTVLMTSEWVIPTGGGYFFAPGISALETLAS